MEAHRRPDPAFCDVNIRALFIRLKIAKKLNVSSLLKCQTTVNTFIKFLTSETKVSESQVLQQICVK
jgi:hypothetical protein